MAEKGKQYILAIRRTWKLSLFISGILIAVACTMLVMSLLYRFYGISILWGLPLLTSILILILQIEKPWKINGQDVSRFLNQRFPEMEESTQLFLKPSDSLSFLEKVQAQRIEPRLDRLPKIKHRSLVIRLIIFIVAVLLSLAILKMPLNFKANETSADQSHVVNTAGIAAETLPAKVSSVSINVRPPAYTGKGNRNQTQFSLLVETGAQITWKLKTSVPVREVSFIFNDRETVKLRALNKENTLWEQRKVVSHAGFYQVKVNEDISELYQIQTVKDQPPFIRIATPKQYTTIDFGEPQRTLLKVSVSDDYGVNNAVIVATTASGQGEGVKFTEKVLRFAANFRGESRQYNLKKAIDLKALGMIPGDELYFYVKALDNLHQESRSETFFVSIQDTAELMDMEGMSSGVNLVPEYFRSMRQIIIDTEKLIKERSVISKEDFNNRSNNLGMDQKLLRLRYGKFLGEESEETGHEESAKDEPAIFGDQSGVIKEFGHNHDNAEDATFFEPELKSQLKATLTEMWNSELRLRTYKPTEALPFEYKALRLLKDLQQKSRAYVAKTSINTPPLKPGTRLSGELDKIINPFNTGKSLIVTDPIASLRKTPEVLNKLKANEILDSDDRLILAEANKTLSAKAVSNPAAYLGAVILLRKIIGNDQYKPKPAELSLIESSLQKAIPVGMKKPQPPSMDAANGLSREYFKNLNHLQQ